MKQFLLYTLCFFGSLFLGGLLLDAVISYGLKKSHGSQGEFEVWEDIYNGNIHADIALYGSSRAWIQIDPHILKDSLQKEVYDFGLDGHEFWLQYLRHIKYIEHNPRPETIIYSFDISSLEMRTELYNPNQFLPYMLWDVDMEYYTAPFTGFTALDYRIPVIRYYGRTSAFKEGIQSLLRPGIPAFRDKGYRGSDMSWNNDLEKARTISKSYTVVNDTTTIRLFRRFIEECRQNNTRLIFVYSPEYIEGQNYISNRSETIAFFKSIADEYAVPFIDYSNDSICLHKEYFYNSTHLNRQGSSVFSKKLASDLKAYIK